MRVPFFIHSHKQKGCDMTGEEKFYRDIAVLLGVLGGAAVGVIGTILINKEWKSDPPPTMISPWEDEEQPQKQVNVHFVFDRDDPTNAVPWKAVVSCDGARIMVDERGHIGFYHELRKAVRAFDETYWITAVHVQHSNPKMAKGVIERIQHTLYDLGFEEKDVPMFVTPDDYTSGFTLEEFEQLGPDAWAVDEVNEPFDPNGRTLAGLRRIPVEEELRKEDLKAAVEAAISEMHEAGVLGQPVSYEKEGR